jgi:peroxiredoxin
VGILVISFAEPEKLAAYQERHQWPFAILADPKRTAYRAFTLRRLSWFRVFSVSTIWQYLKLLRRGMVLRGYGKDDIYQGGGDFLIDTRGNILFAHRSQDPSDRPLVSRLFQEIEHLRS